MAIECQDADCGQQHRSRQREEVAQPNRNVEKMRRLAVLELFHASDEEAPGDQRRDHCEGEIVRCVQRHPAARAQTSGKEFDYDIGILHVAVGKEGKYRDPAGELGDLVVAGDWRIEEIASEHADPGHGHNPDQEQTARYRHCSC